MSADLTVTLVHELPGRIRTKLSNPPADLHRFQKAMLSHDGLESVAYNAVSKSLLIKYERGHLTTEEILLRTAIALSMEHNYKAVVVRLGEDGEVMTDAAMLAGLTLLAAGGFQLASKGGSTAWFTRLSGMAVALAVAEHGWREAKEQGYVHPEVLSVAYLFASWLRGNILRGAAVTWVASFGRHLLQGPEKNIDVRPVNKYYEEGEARTYQISLVPQQHPKSPLLQLAQGMMGIFGFSGAAGSGDSLYEEIRNMAQAHDKVLEGLDLQPNGIPLTFRKEFDYEH
jgi:hypothetical protein